MRDASYPACGRHVMVDIAGADPAMLDNLVMLEHRLVQAARSEGVTVIGTLSKAFEPSGVTIVLLLAESHVSLHTYPDEGKAFFDAFTCGTSHEPANIFSLFAASVLEGCFTLTHIERGQPSRLSTPPLKTPP